MMRRTDLPAPPGAPGGPSERGLTSVYRARSLQSRISSLLALGVTIGLGVCLLAWYYGSIMNRHVRVGDRHAAAAATDVAESSLPPLGRIDAPLSAAPAAPAVPQAPPLPALSLPVLGPAPAAPATVMPVLQVHAVRAADALQPGPTPAEATLLRRLSGPAFARQASGAGAGMGPGTGVGAGTGRQEGLGMEESSSAVTAAAPGADAVAGLGAGTGTGMGEGAASGTNAVPAQPRPVDDGAARPARGQSGDLEGLLMPDVMSAARARMLPPQQFLLAQGTFIDCTLETAIDSTLPGMTTCITATDTFSVDGKVVLLERGSKLIGETRGQVQQGSARLFVLWTQARTPTGVVVPLASPGTDPLGRSGLSGEVDRHFWQRFGAAILVSVIDGALQDLQSRSSGTAVYGTGPSENVATEALRGTIGIAPTILKNQGDRIQILVARDLDFRSVYELREAGDSR